MTTAVEVRVFDFNRLPEPVRRRLIGVTAGGDPNCVILHRETRPRKGVRWGLLGAGLLVPAIFIATRPDAVFDPWSSVWMYALAAAPLAFGLGLSVRGLLRRREWPLTPGKYLFEYGYVELADGKVSLIPNEALERSQTGDGELLLHYRGGVHRSLRGPDVGQGRAALERALEQLPARSEEELAVLNPLHGAEEGMTAVDYRWRRVPAFAGLVPILVLCALLSTGLGAAALHLNNALTEAGMFAAAQEQDTVHAWEAYAKAGGRRGEWALRERIPEIVYTDALAAHSAISMAKFLEAYPDSAHAEDARAFLAASEAEAEAAAKARAEEDAELAAAAAPLPKPEALAVAKGMLAREDVDLVSEERALMEAVYAWCEALAGPCEAQLVSSGPGDAKLEALDAKLDRLRAIDDAVIVPTHIALHDLQRHGHARLGRELVGHFEGVLGSDLLHFEDDGADLDSQVERREGALFVHMQWAFDNEGRVYRGEDDATAYADIDVDVLVTVEIPGRKEALTIRLASTPASELSVSQRVPRHLQPGDLPPPTDSVYGQLIRLGVASLETELELVFDTNERERPIEWGRKRLGL